MVGKDEVKKEMTILKENMWIGEEYKRKRTERRKY